jgi:hypothetical protein
LKTGSSARWTKAARVGAFASLGCIALSTLMSVGTSDVARAAASPSPVSPSQLFGVHPVQEGRTTLPGGHFNFALVAGQRISDAIVVVNYSDHTLNIHVYGADLLTAVGGGLAPAQPTATMHAVGAWITVSAPTIAVAAHSQVTDAFTLAVPAVVSPGQHLGAVVASASAGTTPQGNPIEARVALIAVVTVPGVVDASGALSPLSMSTAGSGSVRFGITLSNTGNVLLTYAGSIDITTSAGRHVATIAVAPTSAYVVPAGQVPLVAIWKDGSATAGDYRAKATIVILADGTPAGTLSSQVVDLQVTAAFPALAVAVGVVVTLLLVLLATWSIRRRRRYGRILTRDRAFPVPHKRLTGVR